MRVGFHAEDIDAALLRLDETLDIDRADLDRLLREVEHTALVRARGGVTCADITARDVVTIGLHESAGRARDLLFEHDIRTLPIVNARDRLVGTVGLREVTLRAAEDIAQALSPARTAGPDEPAVTLVPLLIDGRAHAVVTGPGRHRPGPAALVSLWPGIKGRKGTRVPCRSSCAGARSLHGRRRRRTAYPQG